MNTSYYFSNLIDPSTMNLVGISQSVPRHLKNKIKRYKPLCPPWSLIWAAKRKQITQLDYEKAYYELILKKLDPQKVYEELGPDAVLLCWEKPNEFCHRHLVAKWLSDNLNLIITEL